MLIKVIKPNKPFFWDMFVKTIRQSVDTTTNITLGVDNFLRNIEVDFPDGVPWYLLNKTANRDIS